MHSLVQLMTISCVPGGVGNTGFCTGMETGAPRVCATGKNPTHYGIFDLWKLLWHSRVQ